MDSQSRLNPRVKINVTKERSKERLDVGQATIIDVY